MEKLIKDAFIKYLNNHGVFVDLNEGSNDIRCMLEENLKDICRGRTVLIIAHRLSTINNADYIMSVDKGNIIEYGEPKELLKNKNSFYRYLMEKQLGGDRNE